MLLTDESFSWIGRVFEALPYQVTAIDIAKFAYTIGATDPCHFDLEQARRQGYPDILAPLGYYLVIRHTGPLLVPRAELLEDGVPNDLTPPSVATRRMAGDSNTRFHRRIFAGDVITLRKKLSSIEEKQGRSGPLAFVTYELEFIDQNGAMVVDETYVRILR